MQPARLQRFSTGLIPGDTSQTRTVESFSIRWIYGISSVMSDLDSDADVQAVVHMMTLVGVPLASFIGTITAVQHRPQAIGFDFDCKDSFSLMKALELNRYFRADDPTSWIGAEASSNAR